MHDPLHDDGAPRAHSEAKPRQVRVMPLVSRYIADEYYAAGQETLMDADRARRYVALGEFKYMDQADARADVGLDPNEPPSGEEQGEVAGKMRGAPENKDKRQAAGALPDGTEGEPDPDAQDEATTHSSDAQPTNQEKAEAEAHAPNPADRPHVRAGDKRGLPDAEGEPKELDGSPARPAAPKKDGK